MSDLVLTAAADRLAAILAREAHRQLSGQDMKKATTVRQHDGGCTNPEFRKDSPHVYRTAN